MPTYEYACTECGDRTEVVQSISDASLTTCTVCGGQLPGRSSTGCRTPTAGRPAI